jgi:ABC-type sugar transport system ATPase subunit
VSIVLISHRISDLLQIGDRITVLKGGGVQGVLDAHTSRLEDVEGLIVRGRASEQAPAAGSGS